MRIVNILKILTLVWACNAHAAINIVAAENFYGELAHELGGKYVHVVDIISNPNVNPHMFSTSSWVSRATQNANIIIYNGDGYDSWMQPLLAINNKASVINVANVMHLEHASNPHVWYRPDTFGVIATTVTHELVKLDPKHAEYFNHQLGLFLQQNHSVLTLINTIKQHNVGNNKAIATEPVFNYMLLALGFKIYALDFQYAMMRGIDPSAHDIMQFENMITMHKVNLLIYNRQVVDTLSTRVVDLAYANHVPVAPVREMMPNGLSINQWLLGEIKSVALASGIVY